MVVAVSGQAPRVQGLKHLILYICTQDVTSQQSCARPEVMILSNNSGEHKAASTWARYVIYDYPLEFLPCFIKAETGTTYTWDGKILNGPLSDMVAVSDDGKGKTCQFHNLRNDCIHILHLLYY